MSSNKITFRTQIKELFMFKYKLPPFEDSASSFMLLLDVSDSFGSMNLKLNVCMANNLYNFIRILFGYQYMKGFLIVLRTQS